MRPLALAMLLALGLAACARPGPGAVPAATIAAAPATGSDATGLPDSVAAGADASAMLPPAY